MKNFLLGSLVIFLCPIFLRAASLDPNTLPADVAWVAHLDLAQCRAAFPPLDESGSRLPADTPLAALLTQISSATGFDLLEAGESLTACGNGKSTENRVWLRLPGAKEKLARLMGKNPSAASTLQHDHRTSWLVPLDNSPAPQLIWLTPVNTDLLLITAQGAPTSPQIPLRQHPPGTPAAPTLFPKPPPADAWFCAALDAGQLRQHLKGNSFAPHLSRAAFSLSGTDGTIRLDAQLQATSAAEAVSLLAHLEKFPFASLRIQNPALVAKENTVTFSGTLSRTDLLAQLPPD